MEIILLATAGWLITALLIAKAGKKFNKKFLPTFLFSLFLSPIAGLIYLNLDPSSPKKKTKRGGPWSTWISKAEEAQNHEDYQLARSYYLNALNDLQDPNGDAKYYYKKYILSKISEVNYALSLLDTKRDKQITFNVKVEKTYLRSSLGNLSSSAGNSKAG
jgi:hypothetical protein